MNKVIGIILVLGIGYWIFGHETVVDRLMDVEHPIQATEASGVQYYDPEPGSVFDMADLAEPGLITVVHLYKPSCRGCKIMDKELDKLLSIRPDIAIRQVPSPGVIGYQAVSQGEELNVNFVPFILVFDGTGQQLASDNGEENEGEDLLVDWLNSEVDRKNDELRAEWERKHSS